MFIVSHKTAFYYWRNFCNDRTALKGIRRDAILRAESKEKYSLNKFIELDIPLMEKSVIDLLFFSKEARLQISGIRAHVTTSELPAGAVLRLSEDVGVVSPELCFLQMAQEFSTRRLVLAGTELCGTYALVGEEGRRVSRPALTSSEVIRAFIAEVQPKSTGRAHRAMPYVLNGAASPMEAKLALLLSLPTTWGGRGLPAPVLNAPIILGSEARRVYPHDCRADLYWPEVHLDVEYDGEEAHTGEMHAKDVARTAALRLEHVDVVTLAAAQVYAPAAFAEVAEIIARRLGKSVRTRTKDFAAREATLRAELGL